MPILAASDSVSAASDRDVADGGETGYPADLLDLFAACAEAAAGLATASRAFHTAYAADEPPPAGSVAAAAAAARMVLRALASHARSGGRDR